MKTLAALLVALLILGLVLSRVSRRLQPRGPRPPPLQPDGARPLRWWPPWGGRGRPPLVLLLLVLAVSSCGLRVVERREIPKERRGIACQWLVEYVAAANPKSDEEPEDSMAEAHRQALALYGEPVWYVLDLSSQRDLCRLDEAPDVVLEALPERDLAIALHLLNRDGQ